MDNNNMGSDITPKDNESQHARAVIDKKFICQFFYDQFTLLALVYDQCQRDLEDAQQHCYTCKQPGHYSSHCPRKGFTPKPVNKTRCFKCQQLGHWMKECPLMLSQSSSRMRAPQFDTSPTQLASKQRSKMTTFDQFEAQSHTAEYCKGPNSMASIPACNKESIPQHGIVSQNFATIENEVPKVNTFYSNHSKDQQTKMVKHGDFQVQTCDATTQTTQKLYSQDYLNFRLFKRQCQIVQFFNMKLSTKFNVSWIAQNDQVQYQQCNKSGVSQGSEERDLRAADDQILLPAQLLVDTAIEEVGGDSFEMNFQDDDDFDFQVSSLL